MLIFLSARIRLTVWYVVIVLLVSASFSAIIYRDVTLELENSFARAETRLRGVSPFLVPHKAVALSILYEDLAVSKQTVLLRLLFVNAAVLASSALAAYFLAQKTLAPIEEGVARQKRFVADASHELRTPLTSMRSEIEVALMDKKLKVKDAKLNLASNLEEVLKMQELVNDLLSLSRYEAAAGNLSKEKINLALLVKSAFKKHKKRAFEKKIALKLNLKNTYIWANKASIEELISILLDNAIKYTEKGYVKVSVFQDKRDVKLQVEDTGIGIRPKDTPRIFDRFFRADLSRSKESAQEDGYGLGLSIAKSIVDINDAEISVKSKPGRGSLFTVSF